MEFPQSLGALILKNGIFSLKVFKTCFFEGKEVDFVTINDRWFHYFGSIVLGHNLDSLEDFGSVINILIDL